MKLTQRGAESNRNRILIWAVPAMLFMVSLATPTPSLADGLTIGDSGCGFVSVSSGGASVSCGANGSDITNVSAFGDLSKGIFGVLASVVQVPCLGLPGGCGATIGESVEVTYLFPVVGVSSGIAQFNLTANGIIFGPPPTDGQGSLFEIGPGQSVIVNGIPGSASNSLPSGMTSLTVDTPITDGSAILNFALTAFATCNADAGSCASQSDFLDPLTITGASAFDANGNPVSATFVSESGFNPNAVPAPEPSSLSLLCIGMLGLVTLSLKKAVG